jgi:hypothetical protein
LFALRSLLIVLPTNNKEQRTDNKYRMTTDQITLSNPLLPLIPREILFGNPERAMPQISPDGKRLAYLAPSNGVLNVWMRTIGKEDDTVITNDTKRGIRQYFWAENNSHLIYLQDRDGDENWHLYAVDVNARHISDITPHENIQAQPIQTDKNFPNEIYVGMNVRDKRLHDVY